MFLEDFLEEFFGRNVLGEILFGVIFGKNFFGGLFGRNSLFTLSAKLFVYGRN